MSKKISTLFVAVLIYVLFIPTMASAAGVSLSLSSSTAQYGDSVAASGTAADANTFVSIKVVDSNQSILVFDSAKSDANGSYSCTFKVPDTSGELIVVAGYGSNVATKTLTVLTNTPPVAVTGISLDKNSDTIIAGATDRLTATVSPVDASNQSVIWASDNLAVATVSDSGLVTAVSAGTANITVTTVDGNKTAACAVTVNTSAVDVSLTLSSTTGKYGDSITASGIADANTWVSLKVIDSHQSILVFDSAKSDANGNYSIIFKLPDVNDTLTVVAGYGSNVAAQELICEMGETVQPTVEKLDGTITMADGNQRVSDDDNTWILSVAGGTLKADLSINNLQITGLPQGLTVTAVKPNEENRIVITATGNTNAALTNSAVVTVKILKSAFFDTNAEDSGEVNLNIKISDCFIATAAYGSYLNPHVMVLRNFRDEVLLHSATGSWFVSEYYRYSPAIAAVIRIHPTLKWITRIILSPIIYAVEYPLLALCLFIGLLGLYGFKQRKRSLAV